MSLTSGAICVPSKQTLMLPTQGMIRTLSSALVVAFLGVLGVACTALNDPICPDTPMDCRPGFESLSASRLRSVNPLEPVPRARRYFHPNDAKSPIFVGLSFSGGGSRAANFALAVLKELDEVGLLAHVDAIASTSGGGLAGAYYALNGPKIDWDIAREEFRSDFLGRWIVKQTNPINVARVLFTDDNRSDLMAEVFDEQLFHGARYGDLGAPSNGRPRWLATSTGPPPYHRRFVFSEEDFVDIGSRLDTYSVARAVMASGAFPGVFNSITLAKYPLFPQLINAPPSYASSAKPTYLHVFDGGPTDNLGLETLIELAATHRLELGRGRHSGCFFFVVDAYAPKLPPRAARDNRGIIGRFIDLNFLDAVNTLLEHRRDDILRRAGIGTTEVGGDFWAFGNAEPLFTIDVPGFGYDFVRPYAHFVEVDVPDPTEPVSSAPTIMAGPRAVTDSSKPPERGYFRCSSWHISLSELRSIRPYLKGADGEPHFLSLGPNMDQPIMKFRAKLWRVVVQTETNYRLVGPKNCSPKILQDALFDAARVAVRDDLSSRGAACSWFKSRGVPVGANCVEVPAPQEELSHPIGPRIEIGYDWPSDDRVECIGSDTE